MVSPKKVHLRLPNCSKKMKKQQQKTETKNKQTNKQTKKQKLNKKDVYSHKSITY